MFVVAGCSGPLPNAVPLPLARSSPPVSQSSTPSSRDSIWNGKPAPSTYLHKLLDVTATRNILYIFQKWVMMSAHNRPMLPAATRVHGARLVDALDEVGRGGSSNSRLPWGSPCLSARGGLV